MKIITSKKWKEMQDNHNKLVKNNIDLTLEVQDLKEDIDIYLEQVEYLRKELTDLKEKYEKKSKKLKKVNKKIKKDEQISLELVEEKPKKRVGRPRKESK